MDILPVRRGPTVSSRRRAIVIMVLMVENMLKMVVMSLEAKYHPYAQVCGSSGGTG